MQQRVQAAGESSNDCRKRIMSRCAEQWRDNPALRIEWKNKARIQNRISKALALDSSDASSASVVVTDSKPSTWGTATVSSLVRARDGSSTSRLPVLSLPNNDNRQSEAASCAGYGPLGLGDTNWAIAEASVQAADALPGFVSNYSAAWKSRAGSIIASPKSATSCTYHLSCTEAYGFCFREIRNMDTFKVIERQLVQHVRNHRLLHLVHGKNCGPKVDIAHPLLLLKASGGPMSKA